MLSEEISVFYVKVAVSYQYLDQLSENYSRLCFCDLATNENVKY